MLSQIKKAGFKNLELGYKLTNDQLKEVVALLKPMELGVLSVHNFCPLPYDGPSPRHPSNHYRLSSLDSDERRRAVLWTNHSIDTAVSVGAKYVVIHAGTVELENDPSARFLQLYREGKSGSPEFAELRQQVIKLRNEKKEPYLKVLRESLKEVMDYAQKKEIKIGLETRYYPVEIPNCDEIGYFLDIFEKQGMGYWHDVGHAAVNERLGLAAPMSYLKRYADRLIGWHIHGVKVIKDHHAPFDGDFDLNQILPYIKKHHVKVVESHSLASFDQIKEAFQRLENV
jgi:sugar phosphate isomerase/epimerase